MFTEKTTENKKVKTIELPQMLYSIRNHCVGILSNVMNHLYRFIRKQINNFFKKFLFDDTIKLAFHRGEDVCKDKKKYVGLLPTRITGFKSLQNS